MIDFVTSPNGLSVTIDTERLRLHSIEATDEEVDRSAVLYGSREVMAKFATGETRSRDDVIKRIKDVWARRWHEGDPYSAFSVFKKDTGEFLGHVVLGHSAPGISEIAYLFQRAHWGKGYGSEAVQAIVRDYALATVRAGYLLDGKPLEKIVATARPDNPASVRILQKAGMELVSEEEKYGSLRHHYKISV